jgi:hypothetical protein
MTTKIVTCDLFKAVVAKLVEENLLADDATELVFEVLGKSFGQAVLYRATLCESEAFSDGDPEILGQGPVRLSQLEATQDGIRLWLWYVSDPESTNHFMTRGDYLRFIKRAKAALAKNAKEAQINRLYVDISAHDDSVSCDVIRMRIEGEEFDDEQLMSDARKGVRGMPNAGE